MTQSIPKKRYNDNEPNSWRKAQTQAANLENESFSSAPVQNMPFLTSFCNEIQ